MPSIRLKSSYKYIEGKKDLFGGGVELIYEDSYLSPELMTYRDRAIKFKKPYKIDCAVHTYSTGPRVSYRLFVFNWYGDFTWKEPSPENLGTSSYNSRFPAILAKDPKFLKWWKSNVDETSHWEAAID